MSMTRTDHRPGVRSEAEDESRRAPRTVRLFELLLVVAGGTTGVWLIVSVLTGAHR
jgi:hypothetical protein